MNWKRFCLNLGAVAAGGFGAAIAQLPTDAPINGKSLGIAVLMPVIANLIGLFQQPPHQGA